MVEITAADLVAAGVEHELGWMCTTSGLYAHARMKRERYDRVCRAIDEAEHLGVDVTAARAAAAKVYADERVGIAP